MHTAGSDTGDEQGRENFKHQLQQIVGSIQYTNDIDVHVALITAPSYAKEKAEKYFTKAKTNHQIIRQFIDLFGFFQKSPNAMVTAPPDDDDDPSHPGRAASL